MDPVARRYALALTEEAQASSQLADIDADIDTMAQTVEQSRDLRQMLESPVIPVAKKDTVLRRLFEGTVSDLALRFVGLLTSKDRAALLPDVLDAYRALRDERTGTVEATVRTAKPLSPTEVDRLTAALEARADATVRVRYEIDPSLIGGLVVRMGDVVYDQSVKHQLDTLRDQFAERAAVSLN